MKEKLQEWALAAEIVGGIAVVVTLVFLIIETQENTNAIQAQTYQLLNSDLNAMRRDMSSGELATIIVKSREEGLDSLNSVERYQIIISAQANWAVFESAFYSYRRGTLGEDEWERYLASICRSREGQGELELWQFVSGNISDSFNDFVEETCVF